MAILDRVLVPLDGSERAEGVLDVLSRLLGDRGVTRLVLFQALAPAPGPRAQAYVRLLGAEAGAAGAYLSQKARDLSFRYPGVRICVFRGEPSAAILQAAREEGASLIAMTTHGRSGLSRWALGSVAERVLRRADRPVLLSRAARAEPAPDRPRILAPSDGSPTSNASLPLVEEVARLLGAEVVVLHVKAAIAPPGSGGSTLAGPWVVPSAADEPTSADARLAEDIADRLREAGVDARGESTAGDPADVILDHARGLRADVVVMATHGRGGPGRWILGSVTERVLRSCDRPLLVVRAA